MLQTWVTKGGTFVTNKKCLTNLCIRWVLWKPSNTMESTCRFYSRPSQVRHDNRSRLVERARNNSEFFRPNDDVGWIHCQNERSRRIRGYFFTPSWVFLALRELWNSDTSGRFCASEENSWRKIRACRSRWDRASMRASGRWRKGKALMTYSQSMNIYWWHTWSMNHNEPYNIELKEGAKLLP